MVIRVLTGIFLAFIASATYSQTTWHLSKDKNGIKVYTSQDEGSKFKLVKVEAAFTGTLQKLESILMDVAYTTKWVYATKTAYPIKKLSDREILYYTETTLPWPVNNRDIVIKMKLEEVKAGRNLKVVATGMPDAAPLKKGIVRLPFLNAVWDIFYNGKDRLMVNYILKMDPGGSIPAGITNMFVTKGPYETFENLGKLLSSKN